jgi:hypothetical protein
MRSTVALIVRIVQAANAMAVRATRYVLSMPATGASDVPRFCRDFDGLPEGSAVDPAIRGSKRSALLRVKSHSADMPFPGELEFAGAVAFVRQRVLQLLDNLRRRAHGHLHAADIR